MPYEIQYSPSAQKDLDKLPKRAAQQCLRKIERLEAGLQGNLKRLHQHEAAWRLRMGDYRILFDITGDVIVIRRIGHRKHIYDQS